MKFYGFMLLLFVLLLISITSCDQQETQTKQTSIFTSVSGPYLGQKPPGMTPELFAPGIISTGYSELKAVFSPDGRELFYQLWGAPYPVILRTMEQDGRWTEPVVASFSGQIIEGYNISPDGTMIVFSSKAPIEKGGDFVTDSRVRFTYKTDGGWSEPKPLRESIRGYPAIATSGNLYLATGDLWVSRFVDGKYTEMEKLGDAVNTEEFWEEDPYIAPDETYLLFCRNEGFGSWDIFITFRKGDGSWTIAQNMGERINTSATEVYPFVTQDGKYLFFCSRRTTNEDHSETPITYEEKLRILNSPGNGAGDIYWVDAKVIEDYKPEELK